MTTVTGKPLRPLIKPPVAKSTIRYATTTTRRPMAAEILAGRIDCGHSNDQYVVQKIKSLAATKGLQAKVSYETCFMGATVTYEVRGESTSLVRFARALTAFCERNDVGRGYVRQTTANKPIYRSSSENR